jgi:hypothetical protein
VHIDLPETSALDEAAHPITASRRAQRQDQLHNDRLPKERAAQTPPKQLIEQPTDGVIPDKRL